MQFWEEHGEAFVNFAFYFSLVMFRSATGSNHLTTVSRIFRYCALAIAMSFGIIDSSMAASFGKSLDEPAEAVVTAVVRGRVLDEVGKPLAGATVLWKGSPYGVTTDSQGNYQLPLAAGHTVVLFSYAGYVNEEVQVRGAGVQNITLLPAESSGPASSVREKKLARSLR